MRFPHKIIPDFLSTAELSTVVKSVIDTAKPENIHYDRGTGADHNAIVYPFFDWNPLHQPVFELLLTRLQKNFHEQISLDTCHVLDARVPYGIHTDVASGAFNPAGQRDAAWTFIIPLEDYNSHTIIFKEGHDYIKTMLDWIQATNPPQHDIDEAFYQQYLTHVAKDDLRYLTVEQIFPWRCGHLFAADRRCFHVSDNFPANGIFNKRAIIIWSTVPRSL